jgi:hypothetical protein
MMLVGARRAWPLLRGVPSPWLRQLLIPTAKRMRHSLVRPVFIIMLAAGGSICLVAVLR